ncbi:MAG: hypothetical protein RI900_3434 [Actinomycetota bacterium]
MDPVAFLADLEAKPKWLRALADGLSDLRWPVPHGGRLLLTGMGSSWFAADVAARRMRRAGLHAVAELASVEASWPPAPDLTVVGITASGGSGETLALLNAHHGVSGTVALTNTEGLQLPAAHTVAMHAGPEAGGVSCRSYVHTLVMLLHLEHQLVGTVPDLPQRVRAAADAAEHLLAARHEWLPPVLQHLGGPHGCWLLAPAERLGNALQGALMVREGPRRQADGCETGDWNHVDVYLTKTLDYRALLFGGSTHDVAALQWLRDRGNSVVLVGHTPAATGAEVVHTVRHPHDHDPVVALLTEVLVPELAAAAWWAAQ